jgi:hypothetical protein
MILLVCFCIFCGVIVDFVEFDVGCAGAYDGDAVNTSLRQMV